VIVSVEESNALNDLVKQMTAMVAREEQRERDRAVEHELRITLRKQDDEWRKGTVARIDRVQRDLGSLQTSVMTLMKAVDNRVTETANRVAKEVREDAEKTAKSLHAETLETATELKKATTALAKMRKEADDRRFESRVKVRLLGTTARTLVAIAIVVLLASLAFALLEHRHDISGDIAIGLAAAVGVAGLVYNLSKKSG
jgi:hypothetical protein